MEQIIRSTSAIDANLAASLIGEAKSAAFKSRAIGIGAASLALSLGAAAILWAHNQSVDPEILKAALGACPFKLILADLDENIIRRSLPFGVYTSIGAVETHASEKSYSPRFSEICDYSDRLLASMPPIKVEGTVKADGEVKIAEGATVKLQDGSTVKLADGSIVTVTGTIPAQTQPQMVLPTPRPDENQAIKTTVTVFKTLPHGDGEVTSGWKFASGDAKSPSEEYCYYRQQAGKGTATQQDIANNRVISFAAGVAPAEQAARFQKCQWWQGSSF